MKPRLCWRIAWILCLGCAGVAAAEASNTAAADERIVERSRIYGERYGLRTVLEKAVDNHGEGSEQLYGTRNLRVVLPGVLYRGGANNSYHRTSSRDNRNPLPIDGLTNLCREGFDRTVYLYSTNFEDAPSSVACTRSREIPGLETGNNSYLQLSPFDEDAHETVIRLIYETILDGTRGPVYVHCWNGWHASGFMAATALIQFCDLEAGEAVAYWEAGTDGHHNLKAYDSVRRKIREFRPYERYRLPPRLQDAVCMAAADTPVVSAR